MAYAALFAVLTDLGLGTVATREISRDPGNEHHVLGTILVSGLALSLVAIALGLGLMELVYPGAGNAPTRQAIVILLVQVLVAPVSGASRAFFTARQRGYLIAAGDITLAVVMALLTAGAVIGKLGYHAVVIAAAGGYVAQAAVMGAVAVGAGARPRPRGRGARRLMWLALPLGGTLLLNYLYFRLDVLLLSWLKTDADVAVYGVAYRVLEGLMVLPSYVMLAVFPSIARSEEDPPRRAAIVGTALGGLEVASLGMAALMAIFSREIAVALGGPKYSAAGPVLAILSLALAISYVNGVYGNALMALGRQHMLLWVTLWPLSLNIVANLVLIPPLGVNGAAIAVVLSELVGLWAVRRLYVRVAGAPAPRRHGRLVGPALVLAALAAVKFALGIRSDPLVVLLLGGALGAVLYAAAVLAAGALPRAILDQMPLPRRLRGSLTGR
jgi:O-antigen/teichoic acid export membrane protein